MHLLAVALAKVGQLVAVIIFEQEGQPVRELEVVHLLGLVDFIGQMLEAVIGQG